MVTGNESSRQAVERVLRRDPPPRCVALEGPDYVGKRSFVSGLLRSLCGDMDFLPVPAGIDGARQARSFVSSHAIFGLRRAVLVDEVDRLGDPAQDAYLKLVEECPPSATVVFVASDLGRLLPSLRSRLSDVVKWFALSDEEVASCCGDGDPDPDAVRLCRGFPGLYDVLASSPFVSLHEVVSLHITGEADPLLGDVPEAVKNLPSGPCRERDAVSHVCRLAALSFATDRPHRRLAVSFLRYAADLACVPSANAELLWRRACLCP